MKIVNWIKTKCLFDHFKYFWLNLKRASELNQRLDCLVLDYSIFNFIKKNICKNFSLEVQDYFYTPSLNKKEEKNNDINKIESFNIEEIFKNLFHFIAYKKNAEERFSDEDFLYLLYSPNFNEIKNSWKSFFKFLFIFRAMKKDRFFRIANGNISYKEVLINFNKNLNYINDFVDFLIKLEKFIENFKKEEFEKNTFLYVLENDFFINKKIKKDFCFLLFIIYGEDEKIMLNVVKALIFIDSDFSTNFNNDLLYKFSEGYDLTFNKNKENQFARFNRMLNYYVLASDLKIKKNSFVKEKKQIKI